MTPFGFDQAIPQVWTLESANYFPVTSAMNKSDENGAGHQQKVGQV